jgi:hypothetical protein
VGEGGSSSPTQGTADINDWFLEKDRRDTGCALKAYQRYAAEKISNA